MTEEQLLTAEQKPSQSVMTEALRLAGRIIMENGGETYRVEETITRMGRAFGLESVESFAVPSGLFFSFRRPDGETETAVTRIHRGATNLQWVNEVNTISRQVEARELDAGQALARLRAVEQMREPREDVLLPVAAAVCGAGFAMMFGGGVPEMVLAALASTLSQMLSMFLARRRMQAMVGTLLGSLITALVPTLAAQFFPLMLDATVGGALMPLLPGLAMTNAVQDAMRGDLLSGLCHGISAILTAGLIACGTLMASGLVHLGCAL